MSLEDELAKAAGQIAVDSAKDFRSGIGRLFSPALTELGEAWGDHVRMWRLKNLASTFDEVQRIFSERGIALDACKALPFGDAVRVIEAASKEDDSDVQKLWARLIANSTKPDGTVSVQKYYVDLLQSLSAPEVVLLDVLWRLQNWSGASPDQNYAAFLGEINGLADLRWRKFPKALRTAAMQNLLRLRCIAVRPRPINAHNLLIEPSRTLQAQSGLGRWAGVHPENFRRVLTQLAQQIYAAGGAGPIADPADRAIATNIYGVAELGFVLTDLGSDLMGACSPNDPKASAEDLQNAG